MDRELQSSIDNVARATFALTTTAHTNPSRILELNNDIRLATIELNNLLMRRERAPHDATCLAILATR